MILAGGSGRRLGSSIPKQYLEVGGRMILEHTVDVFEKCEGIDEICIVVHADHLDEVAAISNRNGWGKVRKIIAGGKERSDSSIAAIAAYKEAGDEDIMLFHDSVRPKVSGALIRRCLEAMETHEAAAAGVATTDTIWEVNGENEIESVPDRGRLRNAQTPQCFRMKVIREAYSSAVEDPDFHATDDCGVVLRYTPEYRIQVVDGDPGNIKVTYREDLANLR